MLQQVNLYLPEFRKQKHWLDAVRMVQMLALVAAVLVLMTGYGYWRVEQLRGEFAASEGQRQQAVAATADLRARFGVQSEDPALLADIRLLEESLQAKEALLQFLSGRNLGNSGGFSEYLADLSRYHLQGLSLTRIDLVSGGASVRLAGQVLEAELVPLYLQYLSQGHSFAGMNFENLQIREGPGDANLGQPPVWLFEVRSQTD